MGERQDGAEPMTPEVAVMVLKSDSSSARMIAVAVNALAELVDQNVPERVDLPDDNGYPACWHFVGFRPDAAALGKHTPDQLNPPDAPQYQGVVFADGTVVMRWLTARRSWSVWESFAEMFDVHGHPEYGTRIAWTSGEGPQEALDVINAAMDALAEKKAAEAAQAAEEDAQTDRFVDSIGAALERQGGYRAELVTPVQDPVDAALARGIDRHNAGVDAALHPELPAGGNTLVVCLECAGVPDSAGGSLPLIVPFTEKADADSWLQVHRDNNQGHRVVTVPGWPSPGRAIALARQHGRELRAAADQPGGPRC